MPKPPGPARAPLSIPLSKQYRQCNVPGCTKRNLGRGKCGPGRGCRPTEAACSLGCGRILKGRRKCDAGKGCLVAKDGTECTLGCGRILKGRRKCDAGRGCRAEGGTECTLGCGRILNRDRKCNPGKGCRATEAECTLGCGRILKGRRKCDAGKGCRATDAKGSHGSSEELVELCEATLRTAKRKTGRTPPGMYKASAKQLSPRPALPPMKKKRKPRAGMKLRALQKEAEVRSTLVLIVPPCLDWIGSRLVHTHEPTILMSRPYS